METDHSIAFRDIQPVAPTHILIAPKAHVVSLDQLDTEDEEAKELWADLANIARQLGRDFPQGWRLVTNIGDQGGQSVHHLHLHFLAGRQFTWPPG
ncbi:MAG TPA: HIT domain-containing protein [Acidimicrobiia bacterium]|nr:HIT domain-containing protein [Acidimicrobiia bacterium]